MTATAIRRSGLLLALTAALLVAALVTHRTGRVRTTATACPLPAELRVSTERGSLDVALSWDDVEGADYYLVRWRVAGPGNELNDGISVQTSDAVITVSALRRVGG